MHSESGFWQKEQKNAPDVLENDSAECVYGTMTLNKVDRIFHQDIHDVEWEFGDNRTKFWCTQSDFDSQKAEKMCLMCTEMALLSECMAQ